MPVVKATGTTSVPFVRVKSAPPSPSLPPVRKPSRVAVLLTLLTLVLCLAGAGYFVYWTYVASANPPAPEPSGVTVTPAPTPFPVSVEPVSAPVPEASPVEPAPKDTVVDPLASSSRLEPEASRPETPAAPPPPPEPSAALVAWVSELRVSGVFQGTPSRALINGRMMREGETVDETLGIVFDGVNPDDKVLIFRERSGATVGRRY
jgi:hypothetical protein